MNAQTDIITHTAEDRANLYAIHVAAYDFATEEHIGDCYRASHHERVNSKTLHDIREILQPLLQVTVGEFKALALVTAKALDDCLNANHEDAFYFGVADAISENDTRRDVAAQIQYWACESHAIDSDDGDHNWDAFMREVTAAAAMKEEAA